MLLAVSITASDANQLRAHGVEVHLVEGKPSLQELAGRALELRKLHPRARLMVAGPEKLVRRLAERYPPLVDVELAEAKAAAVLATLDS